MEKLKIYMRKIRIAAHRPRNKKIFYVIIALAIVLWVLFRFAVIAAQNRIVIFNPARNAIANGVPVSVLHMKNQPGVLNTAITVRQNRAFVSADRAELLRPGQKIGNGEIVAVASNIDLDTGMYAVRTRNVDDGLQYAQFKATGFFVPVYAINNGHVFVVRDGMAAATPVHIARQDSDNAYITDGLKTGDIVILSRVQNGDKVQIKENSDAQ